MNPYKVEHDKAVASGFERTDVTEGAINQAEMDLETARMRLDEIRTQLQMAKLALREQEQSNSNTSLYCGVKCNIRELDDVLFKDVGNKIADSGKGMIIMTELGRSKQAATFLRFEPKNKFSLVKIIFVGIAIRIIFIFFLRRKCLQKIFEWVFWVQ